VIAIKFADGVVIAADNLASYGSLARFTDVKRLRTFLDTSVVGFGGDVSDMQYLDRHLNELAIDESYGQGNVGEDEDDDEAIDDSAAKEKEKEAEAATTTESASSTKKKHKPRLNAKNLHRYLSKLLYSRRSSFDPLWNHTLVAGLDDHDRPFLAAADLLGTTYSAPSLATGYGAALAQPIMRRHVPDEEAAAKLSRDEAVAVVRECMRVLFYRDARSLDVYSLAVVTAKGVELSESERLEGQSWAFAERIRGYGTQVV
jgi:20S proteasome subunit beta 7